MVSNQERVIMARVRYTKGIFDINNLPPPTISKGNFFIKAFGIPDILLSIRLDWKRKNYQQRDIGFSEPKNRLIKVSTCVIVIFLCVFLDC